MVILFFSFGDFTNNYLQIYIQKYLKVQKSFYQHRLRIGCYRRWWCIDALMNHMTFLINFEFRFKRRGGVYGSTHGLFLRFAGVQMRIELHKTRFSAWKILLKGGGKFSFGNQAYWRSAPCTSKGKSLWCKMEILKSFILPGS